MEEKKECLDYTSKKDGDLCSCENCELKADCKQDLNGYTKVMRCHDCGNIMPQVDDIEVIGRGNVLSKIQIFVCWGCERIRVHKV